MWLLDNAARIGGVVLILAGLYQLSPLKRACLSKCRTPMAFILTSWRDGYGGAFRMGLEHGLYCLGCCWLLFVILFPLGMMNVAAMAVITLLIFAEKSLPRGPQIGQAAASLLIAYGALVVAMPHSADDAADAGRRDGRDGYARGSRTSSTPGRVKINVEDWATGHVYLGPSRRPGPVARGAVEQVAAVGANGAADCRCGGFLRRSENAGSS